MTTALATFVVWAAAVGGVVYWALQSGNAGTALAPATAGAQAADLDAAGSMRVARALGAVSAEKPVAQAGGDIRRHIKLEGVLTHGDGGAALLAVDGKPAQPVRVGAPLQGLAGDWVLRTVASHSAVVAQGGREVTLDMPDMDGRSRAGDAVAPATKGAEPAPQPSAAARARSRLAHPNRPDA